MKAILSLILILGYLSTSYAQSPKHTETVILNGEEMYYEVYGEGAPLFFLHGWRQSTSLWEEYVASFADNYEVYLVDLQGHGKSSPFTSEFSLESAADNFLALLDHLKLEQINAVGFSYGAMLLLQLTSTNAQRVNSMVLIGGGYHLPRRDFNEPFEDLTPEQLASMKSRHAQGEVQIRALLEQIDNFEILLTENDLEKINSKALIILGENDHAIGLEATIKMHKHLPNSHLWIVPNIGHGAFRAKTDFIRISNEFLAGEWE